VGTEGQLLKIGQSADVGRQPETVRRKRSDGGRQTAGYSDLKLVAGLAIAFIGIVADRLFNAWTAKARARLG